MILDIVESANKLIEPFRDFIMDNQNNPVLWVGIVLIGLAIFGFTYNSLHRD